MYNYNDDYVILYDENGQPYIAHANLREMAGKAAGAVRSVASRAGSALKGMKRAGAKYYARLGEPGHYLYFYSKEELDRYQKRMSEVNNGVKQAERAVKQLKSAYQKNPTAENAQRLRQAQSSLLRSRQDAANAQSEFAKSQSSYNKSINGRASNALNALRSNTGNAAGVVSGTASNVVTSAKDKAQRIRDDIKKKLGVGARANYEKESGEAAEYNRRANTILEGIKQAHNSGDTVSEERLRRTYNLYKESVDKENSEAREAKEAYDSSLAGKINNMISKARKGGQDVKNKASDVVDLIRYNAPDLKDMTADQIKKMNNSIKSTIGTAGDYAKAGREAIQNTTGVGLRNTVSSLAQQLSDAQQTRDTILQAHSAAVDAGDTTRAKELQATFKLIDNYTSDLQQQYNQVRDNYDKSPARKVNDAATDVKAISQSTAQKLMDKFNEGKTLSKQEMSELFAFFGNFMGGGN